MKRITTDRSMKAEGSLHRVINDFDGADGEILHAGAWLDR
jgi:hypothetical protein